MKSSKKISAIILASGNSERFGKDKILFPVEGKPLIAKTVEAFDSVESVDEIVVTASEKNYDGIKSIIADSKKETKVVLGGANRRDSSICGLSAASGDIVLIHDGARPFVSTALIERVLDAVDENTGVIPVSEVTDSVITNSGGIEYLDRTVLKTVQTPQAFDRKKLLFLYEKLGENTAKATDNGEVWLNEYPLVTVEGEKANVKITTPDDIDENSAFTIGNGYDMHRLVKNRRLVLGGIEIPYCKGLLGVSDADVVLHAVMDALLSSAGLPDIGNQFPDTDSLFVGIDSAVLLETTLGLVKNEGVAPFSISITILAQKPKLSPYILAMRKKIAELCALDIRKVGVSTTTMEGIGAVGREEGIACYATVLSKRISR